MKKILIVVNNDKNELIFKGTKQDYIDFCKKDEIEQEEIGIYSCDIKKDLFDNNTPFGECSSNLELHEIETDYNFFYKVYPKNKYKKYHKINFFTIEETKEMIEEKLDEAYEEETEKFINELKKIDLNDEKNINSYIVNSNFLNSDEENLDTIDIY